MSFRVYRLLRNNKEEGPFTAEELIQKNLRPYDLIWIDGRSAAWSYPGELAQFTQYAPLPGEENAINQSDKIQPPVSPSVQAAMAITNNIPAIKEKPRYKIPAAWSKIQTITVATVNTIKADNEKKGPPKKPMVISHSSGLPSRSLSWEEAWQDWESQKDIAKELHEPAPAKSSKKPSANKKAAEPVLETKYAEPLDSLKDKYIENILQQKQRAKRGASTGKAAEFVLPAIALIIIFSAAYWLLNDTEVPALKNIATVKQEPAPPAPNSTISKNSVNDNEVKAEEVVTEEKQKIPATVKEISEQAAERKTSKIRSPHTETQKYIDKDEVKPEDKIVRHITSPVPKTTNTKKAEMPARTEINNVANNNNTSPKTNTGSVKAPDNTAGNINSGANNATSASPQLNTEETKAKVPVKKVTADYVHAPAHIEMINGIASIKIENVSNVDFDLVVVDVQYYSASDSFRKGETLYLHNLKAGRDVVIKTPKDISSSYATSKISLISSDAKQLYVVGEN